MFRMTFILLIETEIANIDFENISNKLNMISRCWNIKTTGYKTQQYMNKNDKKVSRVFSDVENNKNSLVDNVNTIAMHIIEVIKYVVFQNPIDTSASIPSNTVKREKKDGNNDLIRDVPLNIFNSIVIIGSVINQSTMRVGMVGLFVSNKLEIFI